MNEEGRTLYPARHAHVVDLGSSMMLAEGNNTVANSTTIDNIARKFDANETNASRECSREHSLADKTTGTTTTTTTTTTKLSLAEQEVKSLQPHVEYFSTGLEMHPSMPTDNLSRDSEIHDVQKEDEIYGSQANRKVDDTDDAKPLFHDANARLDAQKVTEFDLAAYAKEDLTLSMQQKIMRRMFNAFDVQQHGFLDVCKLKEFCTYVGTNLSSAALEQMYAELHEKEKDKITFDIF